MKEQEVMKSVGTIPLLHHFQPGRLLLIAGPCVVEDRSMTLDIAGRLVDLSEKYFLPLVFKASYRKANRSRSDSFTGIGDEPALEILAEVRALYSIPVITDVHSELEAMQAAKVVDVLQIPAFLCRQTSLLEAAAETGKWVNIKKGQFLSPESMQFAVDKVVQAGNDHVMITERGTTFGYQDLVVDFRGFPQMRTFAPLILDCTHSLQKPNQASGVTGGMPKLIKSMARAGVAVGVDGLFIETHPKPSAALSDGANMLPLDQMEDLLDQVLSIQQCLRNIF